MSRKVQVPLKQIWKYLSLDWQQKYMCVSVFQITQNTVFIKHTIGIMWLKLYKLKTSYNFFFLNMKNKIHILSGTAWLAIG